MPLAPDSMQSAVDSVVLENIKLAAGAGGHALARTHLAGADFDNLVSKSAASSFARREGMLDAMLAKAIEDIRYPDAEVQAASARSLERQLGHPTAESAANLGAGVSTAGMLFKALFNQPPSGYTFYPGPGSPTGSSAT